MKTDEKNTAKERSRDRDESLDFVRTIVMEDVKNKKNDGRVHTRFPPEPNGYLHIGHAKAICLSFGVAEEFGGKCNLRFDDTNPAKEDVEYVDAIEEDVRWLGFDWEERLYYASDYFDRFYEYAVQLVREGKAYVDNLSPDEIREFRGTLTQAGKNSPYRDRTVEENLDLLERMEAGEFEEGECVLRAKIDMNAANLNMRDPTIYRIKKANHHRTGDRWCIYPMYDYAHCLSDSIEGITHSLCTLEFENNRPLYDWFLDELRVECHPQQIEFARLNLTYTVMSKRKLLQLVEARHVRGWDDPRMPTLQGLRRRGYTPTAIRTFCDRIGLSKVKSTVDIAFLEHVLREELNKTSRRVMAVLRPLKLVIDNYPEGKVEWLDAENNPEDPSAGARKIPFSRELYIEMEDFREKPPKKYFRLSPGREIRLKHAYYIRCVDVLKDNRTGDVVELHCTYDPATRGGWSKDGRIVKGTSHWVSAAHAIDAEVRLYNSLFTKENPDDPQDEEDFTTYLNPDSLEILTSCKVETNLKDAVVGERYQFMRQGYFCVDPDTADGNLVFNRTVPLVDTWAKIERSQRRKTS
jgi:glutaminyl-tRNA synthetase